MPYELAPAALAERLTGAGLAVDTIETAGRFERFVAGRIVALEPHPRADRLHVCCVDAGAEGTLSIVSGAPNLEVGSLAALALPGARLSNGQCVAAVEIRGTASQGAVVSEREIGLSDDGAGVLLLDAATAPGTALSRVLDSEDVVLEIDVTPNRGDCLSILGVAREIAALTGVRLRDRRTKLTERKPASGDLVRVEVRAPELCARYVARVVRAVTPGPSPWWMRMRLESLGIRAINNLVDVTNYVMLERGQPLHVFDLERLAGPAIVVRQALERERFRTLDDVDRELEPDDLVIADAERAVAIAGVMGGAATAVGGETRDVLLESAWFEPAAIRRTSRRLGLRSESSLRFERGVDLDGVPAAAARAAELLASLGGGEIAKGEVDVYPRPPAPVEVLVRSERVNRLLGTSLPRTEIGKALRLVSAGVRAAGKGAYRCRPPSWRSDLTREADFVVEVARLVGYDQIPESVPTAALTRGSPGDSLERDVRRLLVAEGLVEMISLRFAAPRANEILPGLAPEGAAPVKVRNPLGADTSEMRMSLMPGLFAAARRNRNQGESGLRGFEIGTVFWRSPEGPLVERFTAGAVLRGAVPARGLRREERAESFFDAKGALEVLLEGLSVRSVRWVRENLPGFLHPGQSARLRIGDTEIGYVGGLHPVLAAELDLAGDSWIAELDIEKLGSYRAPRKPFQPLPRVPAVVRDLAIVAGENLEAQAVLDAIAQREDLLVETVTLFDVYRGSPLPEGKKSLAFSIAYRAADRTLTDEEVNALHERLTTTVTSGLGVEIRR